VGDPHYRTFDGYTFNYQETGEFILSKHLDDFEVQNKQRVCPNPAVRCNMGVAVKAAGHIIIFYADWGVGTALMDGRQVTVQPDVRRDVNDDLSYTVHGNNIAIRFKDAAVRVDINPWDNTHYMDIYVDAPGRWSTGRSLTGLCWNFNNNINDDPHVLDVAAQYWVADSARSLFSHPTPAGLFNVAGGTSLLAAEQSLQMGPEMLAESPPTSVPEHNVEIAFADEAQRKRAEEICQDAHGTDKRDCMFDVVAGEPGDSAGPAAKIANLIDHEKLLQVCLYLRSCPASQFNSTRLDPPQNQEGFSYAFWYIPTAPPVAQEASILGKGTSVQVTVVPNTHKIQVKTGNAHCITQQDLSQNQWYHIGLAVSEHGVLTVWVNGIVSCTNDGGVAVALNDVPLVVGETSMPPATGRMARFFYLPLTMDSTQIVRYSNRQPPGDSCPV